MMFKHKGAQAAGLLATAIAMSAFSMNANAQEESSGFYFGAFGGQSSYDIGSAAEVDEGIVDAVSFLGGFAEINESSLDEKDTSFGVVAGYRFNPYFGLEIGYVDLGSAEYSAEGIVNVGGPTMDFEADASFEATGPTASIVGMLPVSDAFDLYGKAGIFFSDMEIKVDVLGESVSLSGSSEDVFAGVGAAWRIGETWAVNFGFTRFMDVGDEDETGEDDIDQISLGFAINL
jgi:OOP family OmpA-OmpF porin